MFVDRIGFFGDHYTVAMEPHHVERSIPALKSGSKFMRFGNTGHTLFVNLSTMDEMYLSNDPKNWSNGEKDKFY